ncbi:DNA polymerase IV [Methanimicrococcus blatticola]|uniref:DNA polymerase IV n=1 Tax=Methanimicrococcus blatticola TaxID=91560 RepID=A0A484F606_9EURY|nr:DNA polymerase IV [Methanimicrococcus blatticola]MBZ3935569.1 DNA polymerase IV [Methanimicrococcus blatticola]MCC2509211.1 DNA polymerase IV [Methanimicrococcus blatticola]TDQ69422.1 DNA polymerase IV (DinB-like DNA polymerase) [Methanimicrococcus blatticola]
MAADKIIMHIDMDSFFASVEIRDNTDLKDKPVVVCSKTFHLHKDTARGVISAASYPARKFGLHSAMPLAEAKRLCPDVVCLPMNKTLYKQVSDNIIKIIQNHVKTVQQVSIDEAYVLFKDTVKTFDEAAECAREIKKEIEAVERITCSVGIAPNKSVAKIASGFQKPNGLTVVHPEEVADFLSPLPVTKIPGVGKKTSETFDMMRIQTIGDLAKADKRQIYEKLGRQGMAFQEIANGIDVSQVMETADVKSISRFYSFNPYTNDSSAVALGVESVSEEVHMILMQKRMFFKTITVGIRYADFTTLTKSKSHTVHTSDIFFLKRHAKDMIEELMANNETNKKIRQINIGVSNLKKTDVNQMQLTDFF